MKTISDGVPGAYGKTDEPPGEIEALPPTRLDFSVYKIKGSLKRPQSLMVSCIRA